MTVGLRRFALALSGFFLPMEYLSLGSVGSFIFTPSKLAGALLLVVGAAQWLVGPRRLPRSRMHLWVLAVAFGFVTANTVSLLSGLPFFGVLPYLLTDISLLLLYLLVVLLVRDPSDFDWLAVSLVTGATAMGASALLGVGESTYTESGLRLGGFGGNVNEAAGYIAVALPLAFAFWMTSRRVWHRLYFTVAIGLLLVAGVQTFSRAFFVALPLMWFFAAFRLGRVNLIRYGGIGLILAALVVLSLPASVLERMETLESGNIATDTSAMGRLAGDKMGLYAFISNPIAGVGRRNFMNWVQREEGTRAPDVIHNIYISVAAEQGLIGLIPLIGMLWTAWFDFGRAFRLSRADASARSRELDMLGIKALMTQTSFLGVLVLGLFHPFLEMKALWLLLAISTAIRALVAQQVGLLRADESLPGEQLGNAESSWNPPYEASWIPRQTR